MTSKYKQAFNKKTGAWVKYKIEPSGMTKIVNVKQAKPGIPFKGVPKLKRK